MTNLTKNKKLTEKQENFLNNLIETKGNLKETLNLNTMTKDTPGTQFLLDANMSKT